MVDGKVLLTPGPCMTSATVRQAAAGPDLNHRDPEYLELIQETKHRLLSLYPPTRTGWTPYLLGGSGTLAVESMITSCIATGPVLILENGYYSSRIQDIFEIHHIPYKSLSFGWREPWDLGLVDQELSVGYEAAIGAQNETTTGRLNDVAATAALCQKHGTKCLIDAMSSFGADDIPLVDAICASGNKCLHSIPGVSFVLVKDGLKPHMQGVPRRSYYMSLPIYDGDSPPLTPPVPALAALRQALREMPEGGALARRTEYQRRALFLREEMEKRGFRFAIPPNETSCTLTTATIPEGFTSEAWLRANRIEGFVLYGCKGELCEQFFQVANMGELTQTQLDAWIATVDRLIS